MKVEIEIGFGIDLESVFSLLLLLLYCDVASIALDVDVFSSTVLRYRACLSRHFSSAFCSPSFLSFRASSLEVEVEP